MSIAEYAETNRLLPDEKSLMSHCCSSATCHTAGPEKHECPVSGNACTEVSTGTISQHIRYPWKWSPGKHRYYFCDDPHCEVIYFASDNSVILQSQLRTQVGIKQADGEALLCYCYGISRSDYSTNPAIRNYVIHQTRLGLCACESRNPSGRCCLKDFPDNQQAI